MFERDTSIMLSPIRSTCIRGALTKPSPTGVWVVIMCAAGDRSGRLCVTKGAHGLSNEDVT